MSTRVVLLAGLVIAAAWACACKRDDQAKPAEVVAPVALASDFPLHVEHWAEPKVIELRRREKLDDVVAGAASEMEMFARLTSWTNAQWVIGTPDPYPNCSGLDILDAIRAGKTGGFCAQYAYVLQGALKGFGYWAVRVVEIESLAGEGHVVVEVYSPEVDKWVLLDPTHDLHHVDASGVPMNALDLHRAFWEGRKPTVVPGTAPHLPGQAHDDHPDGGLWRYARFAVAIRSDMAHLDRPLTMLDRELMFLRFDAGDARGGRFAQLDFKLSSSRETDLYPVLGHVTLVRSTREGAKLVLELAGGGSWPHFRNYEVRVAGGEWEESGWRAVLDVPEGSHLIEVRAVNVGSLAGPESKWQGPW